MAYDEGLADRIRAALGGRADVEERRMFGGIAFMVAGRMACGVTDGDLMVRVGPDRYEDALARPQTRPMDFTGKPMRGYVYVAPAGIAAKADLRAWVAWAVDVAVAAAPPKPRGRA